MTTTQEVSSPRVARGGVAYFIVAVLAWLFVDFTTTPAIAHPHAYYSKYMPALLLFYLGYPLIFALLIYKFRLHGRGLFFAMLLGIFVVEIVFTQNMLLVTLPVCLIAIPISLAHYSMVTFMPLWAVQKTFVANRKWIIVTLIGWSIGVLLNILTQFGGAR